MFWRSQQNLGLWLFRSWTGLQNHLLGNRMFVTLIFMLLRWNSFCHEAAGNEGRSWERQTDECSSPSQVDGRTQLWFLPVLPLRRVFLSSDSWEPREDGWNLSWQCESEAGEQQKWTYLYMCRQDWRWNEVLGDPVLFSRIVQDMRKACSDKTPNADSDSIEWLQDKGGIFRSITSIFSSVVFHFNQLIQHF